MLLFKIDIIINGFMKSVFQNENSFILKLKYHSKSF